MLAASVGFNINVVLHLIAVVAAFGPLLVFGRLWATDPEGAAKLYTRISLPALVLLWAGPLQQASAPWWEGRDDGWQARGAASTGRLALEALCVAEGVDAPSRRARARECTRRDLMGFAYRVETGIDGQLTLFGVDADGDPMFYLPTPVDPSTPAVVAGRWRALKIAVRLSVNHATGPLRVYALVSPTAATADEVRGWAEQLAGQPAAGSGDAPWIERVSTESLARACPTLARCQAAELAFTIDD